MLTWAFVGAMTGCCGLVIANMRWTSKVNRDLETRVMDNVERVETSVRSHHEDASIHGRTDNLVTADLCGERVKRIEEGQQHIAKNMDAGFERIEKLIRKNGNGK